MEIAEHIKAVGQEAKLLAEAAKQGGLDVDVPYCPGWDMRELVRHLSEIHLWAAAHVGQPHDKPWVDDLSELTAFWPDLAVFWPDDDELVDWYLQTNANLLDQLESAPADLEAFTFLPAPSPRAMWARRQAHETAIHRYDAESAAGIETQFDPAFAADGIDELLVGFAQRGKGFSESVTHTMGFYASDTDDRWHLTLSPEEIVAVRGEGSADITLSGSASDLYLAVWNRADDSRIAISGDEELLDQWRGGKRIRWERG
jgi:uncharacterized protein (TIGR03083 family)